MNQATQTGVPETEDSVVHTMPATLSWKSFTLALGILLAIFMFANPIWEEHDMNAWNQNIWWSYIPIPLIVGLLLLVERKFSWPSLGLEVMKLTFVKFVVTYSMASVIWEFRGAPGTGLQEMTAGTDSQLPAFEVRPVPTNVSTWEPGELSSIAGVLQDATGAPLADHLVYVSAGLEGATFAPPAAPANLSNAGAGFTPGSHVIQTYQLIQLESTSGELHTAVFDSFERHNRVLNTAVIPGDQRELMFDKALGHLTLSCSVHGDAEQSADVLVLHHPFWTRTASDGSFQLEGVPPGTLEFSVKRGGAGTVVETTQLAAGSNEHVEWRLAE